MIKGSHVLDYYTSEAGGLGLVYCGFGGMDWCHTLESFLFPREKLTTEVPEGSRFFVGKSPVLGLLGSFL